MLLRGSGVPVNILPVKRNQINTGSSMLIPQQETFRFSSYRVQKDSPTALFTVIEGGGEARCDGGSATGANRKKRGREIKEEI